MIRPIVKDVIGLSRKALPATEQDLSVARDLLDTLEASRDRCVGMAANMIGQNKRIIAAVCGGLPLVMLNPRVISRTGKPYDAMEGCLCHESTRPARRYPSITVRYQDMTMQTRTGTFSGFTAQIIQHELDHLEGILI